MASVTTTSASKITHCETRELVFGNDRKRYSIKLAQTILLLPVTTTAKFAFRSVKLIAWSFPISVVDVILGYNSSCLEEEYLSTVRAFRDLIYIPTQTMQVYRDMKAAPEQYDIELPHGPNYLQVSCEKGPDQFSSYLHGFKTFEVKYPNIIREFAAYSDGALKTVMASHIFKPDVMAINIGIPNVATFVTEEKEGTIQTIKVDAKSLRRAEMSFHPTNGKIQSGLFFVPNNLPENALSRLKEAALKLEKSCDITCVNTNCRVLKEAGFSIEGIDLERVVLPTTFMEHLLYRNVFYTDMEGKKYKILFDILNTTQHNLEEHYKLVDIAVVGTRFRHRRRNADTEDNRKARGEAAIALIREEEIRLAKNQTDQLEYPADSIKLAITASVPSSIGRFFGKIWGRHIFYEVDFFIKKEEIAKTFTTFAEQNGEPVKLTPFPQKNPSLLTRMKRDIFFSQFAINYMRRHIMGRKDTFLLATQDLFSYLKSTGGQRLNYVLLDGKVVLARVNVNSEKSYRKAADWALSKHGLLAGRKNVYCSGELWYDAVKNRFVINNDSGTYMPSRKRTETAVSLINNIFETRRFGIAFEVEEPVGGNNGNPI